MGEVRLYEKEHSVNVRRWQKMRDFIVRVCRSDRCEAAIESMCVTGSLPVWEFA